MRSRVESQSPSCSSLPVQGTMEHCKIRKLIRMSFCNLDTPFQPGCFTRLVSCCLLMLGRERHRDPPPSHSRVQVGKGFRLGFGWVIRLQVALQLAGGNSHAPCHLSSGIFSWLPGHCGQAALLGCCGCTSLL